VFVGIPFFGGEGGRGAKNVGSNVIGPFKYMKSENQSPKELLMGF